MKNQVVKSLAILFAGLLSVTFRVEALEFKSFYINATYDETKGHVDGYAHERIQGECGSSICGDGKPHFDGNAVRQRIMSVDYDASRDIRLAKLSEGSSTAVFRKKDGTEQHEATFVIGGAFTKSKLQSIWDARGGRGNDYQYSRRKANLFEQRNGEGGLIPVIWYGYDVDARVGPEGVIDSIQKDINIIDQGYKFLEVGLMYSLKLDDVSQWSPGHYSARLQGIDLQQTIWWQGGQSSAVYLELEVVKKLDIAADKKSIQFKLSSYEKPKPQKVDFTLLSKHKKIELELQCSGHDGECAVQHYDKSAWLPLRVEFEVSKNSYKPLQPGKRPVSVHFPSGVQSVLSSKIEIGERTLDLATPPPGNYSGELKFVFNASV